MARSIPVIPRWEESCYRTEKPAANWFVNYIKRKDVCSMDHIADIFKPHNLYMDRVHSNKILCREDYELALEGWHPPVVTVESLIGSPTELMVFSLQMSYKWVRTLKFERNFSTVFALLKMVSLLENCRDVTVTLDDKNVKQSEMDKWYAAYGSPYLYSIKSRSVRSLTILRSLDVVDIQPAWKGCSSRVNLFAMFAFMVFEMLEKFEMNVLGDVTNFEVVRVSFFGRTSYPQRFFPHRVDFRSNCLVTSLLAGNFHGKPVTLTSNPPAPTLPFYMIKNPEFLRMGLPEKTTWGQRLNK